MIRPGTAEDAEEVARVPVETRQVAYPHVLPREGVGRGLIGAGEARL